MIENVTKAEVKSYDGLMEGGIFQVEVHVVQKGDTLWKISRQYGISFEDLKRVNAHLANPDYIVPGMKIFLPDKTKGKGEVKQPSGGGHVQKTEKAPMQKAPLPKEELEVPKQPKPIPEVPLPPKVPAKPPVESKPVPPKPKPEKAKSAPAPKPTPPKEPISPPVQSQPIPPAPMQPYPPFSVIGIPCGWLPIYDADCYPHMHSSQMHPMPMPMPQLPVQPESSHFPGHHLPTKPTKPKITDDWKTIESPKIEEEMIVERPKKSESKLMPEVVPEPTPIPLPQYEMPMPQPVMSMQQNHWRCMQCGVQPSYSGHSLQCGCGSFQSMPMPMPMQHSGHCNTCQQPMQRMPQMMPFPNQNNNWYGTH